MAGRIDFNPLSFVLGGALPAGLRVSNTPTRHFRAGLPHSVPSATALGEWRDLFA